MNAISKVTSGFSLSIERSALLKVVSHVQSVVERRNAIPILANVLIEATGSTVSFRATDLDIEVVEKVAAQVERGGSVTVSASMLHDIVRKLPDGALVQLRDDVSAGRMSVTSGRSSFSLATLPEQDFPKLASDTFVTTFSIEASTLKRLFEKSKFAMSSDETRYYLNGVYMHVSAGEAGPVLRCVATDGHRLARIDAAMPAGADGMPGVIVPRKTVNELRKLLDDDAAQIEVSVSEAKVRFATRSVTLTSKVVDGTFPDYVRVMPMQNEKRLDVDVKDLSSAVDRVSTVATGKAPPVRLRLEDDRLMLSCHSAEYGTAEDEIAAAYSDEPLEVGFNAKYLIEMLGNISSQTATMMLKSGADPVLIRDSDDHAALFVLMLMRV